MSKLILVSAFIIATLCPCYAQERNETPLYGGKPPTPEQARADQQLIETVSKQFGSREEAAKVAVKLGFQFLARNDWKTAMKRFNQAWLLTPDKADVFWGLGAALSYQGKFAESEKYFLKATGLDSDNGRLLNDFGFMYQFWATKGTKAKDEKLRCFDRSIELFEQASRLDPTYDRIYFNWAVSLFFKQDYKGSWEKIKEAERLGGGSVDQKFIRDLTKKMPRP